MTFILLFKPYYIRNHLRKLLLILGKHCISSKELFVTLFEFIKFHTPLNTPTRGILQYLALSYFFWPTIAMKTQVYCDSNRTKLAIARKPGCGGYVVEDLGEFKDKVESNFLLSFITSIAIANL